MWYSIEACPVFEDKRGILAEFVDELFLKKNGLPFGQVYYLSFEGKDVVRGNHYHTGSSEMFCAIYGDVEITIENIETKERQVIVLSASDKEIRKVFIAPKVAHAIKSLSDFAMVISYSSAVYNHNEQDKFPYVIA
jgi:dTDP-4-dehydrorhamnose 3,5-epimerase-like enzyme